MENDDDEDPILVEDQPRKFLVSPPANKEIQALAESLTEADWALVKAAVDPIRAGMKKEMQDIVNVLGSPWPPGLDPDDFSFQIGRAMDHTVQQLCEIYLDLPFTSRHKFKSGDHKLLYNPVFYHRAKEVDLSFECDFSRLPFLCL